jgi:hypothetical protein
VTISKTARSLYERKISKSDKNYWLFELSKLFFTKILEFEFNDLKEYRTPEFREFFVPYKDHHPATTFEDINVPASYLVFAEHNLVPGKLRTIVQAVISGQTQSHIISTLSGVNQYYSLSHQRNWLQYGLTMLEGCLLTSKNQTPFDHVQANRLQSLAEMKAILKRDGK